MSSIQILSYCSFSFLYLAQVEALSFLLSTCLKHYRIIIEFIQVWMQIMQQQYDIFSMPQASEFEQFDFTYRIRFHNSFLRIIMKITICKLPPLPKRNNDLIHPVLQCQSINLQRKYLNGQLDRLQNDEDTQLLQAKIITQPPQSRRPQSNKTQNSVDSRRNSSQSGYVQRNYSQQAKNMVILSEVPPKVTAKSWIVYDMQQGRALWSHRSHKRREMASLTKMMNLVTILELTASLGLEPKELRVKASKTACEISGTTAELRQGAEYTLFDLYFGMMLPSGNDAAYLIAELGGYLFKHQSEGSFITVKQFNSSVNREIAAYSEQLVNSFLKGMNRVARKIDMACSNFANPHGLSNINNYSTAQDLAKLCAYAMRNILFRKIVQTRRYSYFLPNQSDKQDTETMASQQTLDDEKENFPNHTHTSFVLPRQISLFWENTNKMLGQGWSGIKTGITPNAGPCLAASLCRNLEGKRYEFLVVLLCSESMQARWKEVRQLVDWAIQNRRYI